MKSIYRRRSGTVEITAGQAYDAGAIIIVGAIIAVATCPIANGEFAALATEGVFSFPKAAAESAKAMAAGKRVYWDADNQVAVLAENATTGMKFIGYTVAAALTTDETVEVVLVQGEPIIVPAAHIADAETAHDLNATFSDTEVEAALNALGTKLNAALAALEAAGITASS